LKNLTEDECVTFPEQTFTRFVEVGRVVLINYGEDAGKLATVIDVVDAKRVSID
jgi:large subunit ribosomal protein L14e